MSPKLDFDDTENKDNSSVPIVPGVVGGQGGREDGIATSGAGSSTSGTGGSSSKTGPKIHGVRVTVDTGDNHKSKGTIQQQLMSVFI